MMIPSHTTASQIPQAAPEAHHRHRPSAWPEVELDVREDLRTGREPFARIMRTVATLEPESVLHLRATFEPVPLFHVLGEQGFAFESQAHAPDDWSVWFWRPARPPAHVASPHTYQQERSAMTGRTIELDVRVLPPRDKHPTIFRTFEGLAPGESMVIVNDHDPKPLRYQLAAEHPEQFEWAYEAAGPEVWRVRIGRR